MMNCAFCSSVLEIEGAVGRQDICPHCNRDLRCCKQCKFYDPHAYNECREVSAERIVDKERANLCDYFALRGSKGGRGGSDKVKEAKKALEALFKKK
ncbi:MAG: hypothetical protein PVI20_20050 [Desulfobacteraceae bacterium]|jgi:hypothetical protein